MAEIQFKKKGMWSKLKDIFKKNNKTKRYELASIHESKKNVTFMKRMKRRTPTPYHRNSAKRNSLMKRNSFKQKPMSRSKKSWMTVSRANEYKVNDDGKILRHKKHRNSYRKSNEY